MRQLPSLPKTETIHSERDTARHPLKFTMGRFIDGFLPWIIFPPLAAAAFYCIILQTEFNGFGAAMKEQCPDKPLAGSFPFRLPYTGIQGLDAFLCILAATFHESFGPDSLPFLGYFLTQSTSVVLFVYFESARRRSRFTVRFPVVFTVLMQLVSFGATFSFYWLPFIATGSAKAVGSANTVVTQADAEAIIFGNILGYALPTIGMLTLFNPYMTVLWQFIPILASLATQIYLTLRSPKKHPQSGYKTIRANYVLIFVVNIITHIAIVGPKVADIEALKRFFLPSLSVNTSNATNERLILNLLQWDFAFGMGASLLGTLWLARNARQLGVLLIWNTLGSVLLSPGAAMAGVAIWREAKLHPRGERSKKL
ncbi:hypothetical protein V5O48_014418 [Marasmius crinis-equi]|uniref:Uncharacterized protein n=1 Tax=Marasmius crinis-equi TaxID=585013 RepID=A0ABR3EXF3_9AGAR